MENSSDLKLITETLKGNSQAFKPLVEKYWRLVFSIISKYVKNKETVADLCQEVFFKTFTKLEQFKDEHKFAPWIAKIAVNHTIEHLRKEKRFNFIDLDIEKTGIQGLEPDSTLNQNQFFDECLNRLSPDLQILFILRHGVEFSYEDIAFVLDAPKGTVKAALFRIRNQLKESFLASKNVEQTLTAKGTAND